MSYAARIDGASLAAMPGARVETSPPRILRLHDTISEATRAERALALGLACLFVVMRVWPIFSFNTSFDDVWSIELTRLGWRQMLGFMADYDFHPPLFYACLKVWTLIGGDSFVWLATLPVLFSIATLIPLQALFRELRLTPAESNLTLFLLAVNGYLVGYTQELRMYTLLLLMTVTSLLLFVRFCNARSNVAPLLVALGIVNLLAVYSQYFGWLVIATEGLFLLFWDWRKFLMFTGVMIVVGLAFAPWAALVMLKASERAPSSGHLFFQIRRPDLFSLAFFYSSLNGVLTFAKSTTLGVVLFSLPVLWWIARAAGSLRRLDAESPAALLWLIAFAAVPVFVAFFASQLLPTAVWGQRHFIIASIAYLMLIAVAVLRLQPAPLKYVAVSTIVVWAAVAGWQGMTTPYKLVAWDTLAGHLAQSAPKSGTPTRVYVQNDDDGLVLAFFANRMHWNLDVVLVQPSDEPLDHVAGANAELMSHERLAADRSPITSGSPAGVPLAMIRDFTELPGDQFWVASDVSASPGVTVALLSEQLKREGFKVGDGFAATAVTRRWNTRYLGIYPVSRSASRDIVADARTER